MSMLAERKRKQKFTLNPRGKAWSEDSSKFGQKMLEKMGWSQGKGLGANENGITEHIRLSYKNDTAGVGFKDIEEWGEHEEKFSSLLETLSKSSSCGEDSESRSYEVKTSLEEKSQSSKARVHYKKFTRGKDLSRCTEKELACVFGKKTLRKKEEEEKEREKTEENNERKFGVETKNGGSMLDYFKSKLPNFGRKEVGNGDGDSDVEKVGFGFKKAEDEIKKGKKKKNEGENLGVSNPAFDPLHTNVVIEKHSLNTIRENDCEEYETAEDVENEEQQENNFGDEQDKKKKKKKRKMEDETVTEEIPKKKMKWSGIDNPNFTLNDADINESGIAVLDSDVFEVKKKKKKTKKDKVDIENSALEESIENSTKLEAINETASEVKRKKKKQKKKAEESGFENPALDMNAGGGESPDNSTMEVPRKKKKSRKTTVEDYSGLAELENMASAFENPALDLNDGDVEPPDNTTLEVQRKKKKNKKKSERDDYAENVSSAFENPALDVNAGDGESPDNITLETPRKKKKNKRKLEEEEAGETKNKALGQDYKNELFREKNELFEINNRVIREGRRRPQEGRSPPDYHEVNSRDFQQVERPRRNSFPPRHQNRTPWNFQGATPNYPQMNFPQMAPPMFASPMNPQGFFPEINPQNWMIPQSYPMMPQNFQQMNFQDFPQMNFAQPNYHLMQQQMYQQMVSPPFAQMQRPRFQPFRRNAQRGRNLHQQRPRLNRNRNQRNSFGSTRSPRFQNMKRKMDDCQAEVENDLNKEKCEGVAGGTAGC